MDTLENMYNNYEYMNIIDDILQNKEFLRIRECKHHGLTRLDHSLRVSYYSYLICKRLRLNYVACARGGLLHDFFHDEDMSGHKKSFSMFFHPFYSLKNAKHFFEISEIEEDIIINHMFPTLPNKIPRYAESWIVSLVDKVVATYEFYYSYGKSFVYRLSNLYVLLLLFKW